MDINRQRESEENEISRENKFYASSGNRTRAARVAGEHSTTEPTMLALEMRLLTEYLNK